jgi:ParB-like chromosome segregation protein Spo0J
MSRDCCCLLAGLKDADGVLTRRLKMAHARAAVGAGDNQQALLLLREVAEGLSDATDEEKGIMQLLLGDTSYQVRATGHRAPLQVSIRWRVSNRRTV